MTEGDKLPTVRPASVKVFGRTESAWAYAIRDFLPCGDVPFERVELRSVAQDRGIGVDGLHDRGFPVCLFAQGGVRRCCQALRFGGR
jgi:hypothetical protein